MKLVGPTHKGGTIKRAIAAIAMRFGGKKLFGMTFGKRFRGVFANPGLPPSIGETKFTPV